ncbi:hypothetical protein BJV82DRAFT_583804 [Fennellomyces sp. T-0311]|nr:hypothetical protein BJV82DRAFT_583804 [Fennellomyces sp. T-0311]
MHTQDWGCRKKLRFNGASTHAEVTLHLRRCTAMSRAIINPSLPGTLAQSQARTRKRLNSRYSSFRWAKPSSGAGVASVGLLQAYVNPSSGIAAKISVPNVNIKKIEQPMIQLFRALVVTSVGCQVRH